MDTKRKLVDRFFKIENGPGKDTLFDACKYAYSKTASVPVEFLVVKGYTMPKEDPGRAIISLEAKNFRISSIENEDGSGESFNLYGYCEVGEENYRFKAYYNTKTRKGTITLH